jgi:hypothetical protein
MAADIHQIECEGDRHQYQHPVEDLLDHASLLSDGRFA